MNRRNFIVSIAVASGAFGLLPTKPVAARPLYVVIHAECKRPAYLLLRKPEPGEPLMSRDALEIDGSPVEPFSMTRCGSCGEPMMMRTRDIQERNWL